MKQEFKGKGELPSQEQPTEPQKTFEDISAPIEWARNLGPDDQQQLQALLGLSGKDLVLHLMEQGFSQRELGRELDLKHARISMVSRGLCEPLESFTRSLLNFAIHREGSDLRES